MDIYPEALLGKLPFLRKFFFRLLLPIDKYIQENSSKVITISSSMKNLLVETRELEEKKVEVVHNWQNEELFILNKDSNSKRRKDSMFTFMFLGNLSGTAAIYDLIFAFKKCGWKIQN